MSVRTQTLKTILWLIHKNEVKFKTLHRVFEVTILTALFKIRGNILNAGKT